MSKSVRLIAVLWFGCYASMAQVNDAGLWTSLDLQKDFGKKLVLDGNLEFRFNENFNELGTIYGETSLGYKLKKRLDVSLGYRMIGKRRLDDSYGIRHRWMLNASYRHKFKKISTTLRVRYQYQLSDVNRSADWQVPDEYIRTKLALKYDTKKKWTPFVAGESFFHFENAVGLLFNEYRVSVGCDYDLTKKSAISVGYIIDRELQTSDPLTNYVVSLGWKYQF